MLSAKVDEPMKRLLDECIETVSTIKGSDLSVTDAVTCARAPCTRANAREWHLALPYGLGTPEMALEMAKQEEGKPLLR